MNSSAGTLSATGVYTAPSSVSITEVLSVTATSVASPTVSTKATVTLVPTVQVVLKPASVMLLAQQNYQFQATVSGTSNAAVTWSAVLAMGTISSSGVYTAPSSTAKATATAPEKPIWACFVMACGFWTRTVTVSSMWETAMPPSGLGMLNMLP